MTTIPTEIKAIFPDEEPLENGEDYMEIAVWTCRFCFDGIIRFPLVEPVDGKFNRYTDQGIDMFFNQAPIKENHQCTFTHLESLPPSPGKDFALGLARARAPHGRWRVRKLALPLTVREELMKLGWIQPDAPTDESRLRNARPE